MGGVRLPLDALSVSPELSVREAADRSDPDAERRAVGGSTGIVSFIDVL